MESWHVWTVAGLLLIVLEVLTPSFLLGAFAVAALVTALVAAVFEVGIPLQLTVFAVASVLGIAVVRPFVLRFLTPKERESTNTLQSLVGSRGTVTEAIAAGGVGTVRAGGTTWRARAATSGVIGVGESVEITSVDGVTLSVAPVEVRE